MMLLSVFLLSLLFPKLPMVRRNSGYNLCNNFLIDWLTEGINLVTRGLYPVILLLDQTGKFNQDLCLISICIYKKI